MEKYIFIRNYRPIAKKGMRLEVEETTVDGNELHFFHLDTGEELLLMDYAKWPDDLQIHLLKIDADLFKTAFNSFAYTNWLKEKAADIDERGDPRFPGLVKSPETLIMYLMELGINSSTLLHYIYGADNKYLEYKYLVQEFGKMI